MEGVEDKSPGGTAEATGTQRAQTKATRLLLGWSHDALADAEGSEHRPLSHNLNKAVLDCDCWRSPMRLALVPASNSQVMSEVSKQAFANRAPWPTV
jgi:hypothetical protein